MLSNKIKFVAADMDGTLLDEQGDLNPEFFPIYQRLAEKNILFAAASGRQYYSLLQTFEPVKHEMMFIAENGTLVMHQGKELYSCTLEKSAIGDIIDTARSIPDAHIVLCGKKSAYIETKSKKAISEIHKYYHRCEQVEDLLTIDDEFIKIAICHFDGSQKHIDPVISPRFGRDFKVVVSAKIWLDVMNSKASKGTAISHLQQTLGFGFEQTMSFGDYFNDLEMLGVSYYSYAMENAHQEVKQHARFLAPSNKDSGVLSVLKEMLEDS